LEDNIENGKIKTPADIVKKVDFKTYGLTPQCIVWSEERLREFFPGSFRSSNSILESKSKSRLRVKLDEFFNHQSVTRKLV
jgi:hypothetical protein